MGVIITIDKQKAILRDGEWRSASKALETQLNVITTSWIEETGGPGLDSSDPEMEVAREVAQRTGGHLLLQSKANTRRAARTYFARRQYRLSFS
jgi:hypothetical protein